MRDKNLQILVVEDNLGDFVLIEEQLIEHFKNPRIFHVTDFSSAAALLKSTINLPDVILLDLTLPDKSGEHLVQEMMKISEATPLIILTGFIDIDFSKRSIALGVSDYLVKDELNATILFKSILYAIERSRNLATILDSEKRYSNLFNLSPQPMWLYNLDTLRFLQVNKATVDHYGYSESEFLQMTIMEIMPASELEKTNIAIQQQRNLKDDVFTDLFKHQKKSGELITVELYSTPITIDNQYCRSVIAIDVTERIEFEHKVTKAIIKTQEEERYEIGGELHDNVCQILATSLMSLGLLKTKIEAEAIPHLQVTREYISLAIQEIRNLSHRLAPAFFDESTFEEAIEVLFMNLNISNQFDVTFLYSEELKEITINADLQLNLYRIIQEALRNSMKYSKAKKLSLILKEKNNNLVLEITDDGIGFKLDEKKSGIGLANMKRRAELFGGTLLLSSAPGEGTATMVQVPLE